MVEDTAMPGSRIKATAPLERTRGMVERKGIRPMMKVSFPVWIEMEWRQGSHRTSSEATDDSKRKRIQKAASTYTLREIRPRGNRRQRHVMEARQ